MYFKNIVSLIGHTGIVYFTNYTLIFNFTRKKCRSEQIHVSRFYKP